MRELAPCLTGGFFISIFNFVTRKEGLKMKLEKDVLIKGMLLGQALTLVFVVPVTTALIFIVMK